jgi:hypothetical protein
MKDHDDRDCCHGLPVGDHCKWCDDDERGDHEHDVAKDKKLDEAFERELNFDE